ncbi:MAG TPA: HAD-IA family hydrolase [Gemmatimonadaceae bacterium]|nr:HAD-IA family hydrolase [Gemmatimonadaceae bacterium]
MPPPPAAVLFDLDGTLIDSIELILNSARHAFTRLGRAAPSDAEWLAGVGTPLRAIFAKHARGDSDIDDLIEGYREYQAANHDRLVRCYDGVVPTVAALHARGHPLGVVTSKGDTMAYRGLAWVGLDHYFKAVVTIDSSARHKPHPEPVLLALDRLARAPDGAYFVGDSVHDIEAGNAAGVRTVAALWGPFTRDQLAPAKPSYFLRSILDLPALVSGESSP